MSSRTHHIHDLILASVIAAVLILLGCQPVHSAQTPTDKADKLRQEIKVLEDRMSQTEAGRRGVLEQLLDLDQKIELRRRLISELAAQAVEASRKVDGLKLNIRSHEQQIDRLTDDLNADETSLGQLRRQVAERVSLMYRRLTVERLTLILGSRSLNDLSQRRHYLQAVEKYDQNRLRQLREKRDQVSHDRSEKQTLKEKLGIEQDRITIALNKTRKLLDDKRSEERSLGEERSDKASLQKKIESDRDLLRALLEERKRSLDEIEREIGRLVERPAPLKPQWQPDQPFSRLQGSLAWPLSRRKVTQPFGTIKHLKLGTSTVNPGIDLDAHPGDPVRTVAKGEVTRIAWLRGFGNTVILSHGEGFYTVYARLGRMFVSEGDVVQAGQVIGEVGDIGAEGDFHFEIWEKREKLDPMKWLQR